LHFLSSQLHKFNEGEDEDEIGRTEAFALRIEYYSAERAPSPLLKRPEKALRTKFW